MLYEVITLLNQVPEALESLKRSIEIDVKNARKSIRDRDFLNVRTEDGFKRIEEVVVLESIRQGYHTIGAIVWTTYIDTIDVKKALKKLMDKGLIIQNEKRDGLHRIPVWDLAPVITSYSIHYTKLYEDLFHIESDMHLADLLSTWMLGLKFLKTWQVIG